MGRYRKIDPRIWNDAKFRVLSEDAKLVFFMLLTHPNMTSLGAMRATRPGLAAELRWPADRFCAAFAEVLAQGLCEYDEGACFVGLPNFLRYNQPESPNVVKCERSNRVSLRFSMATRRSEGMRASVSGAVL